jgi:hypothetical protein
MRTFILISILSTISIAVQAGSRTSASYSIATDVADRGGRRATSANYTNDGSAGGVAGISTVAAPVETAKHGFLGQLYEVTGLTLSSAQPNVNEGATLQLAAWQLLDDASFLAVNGSNVSWSVLSGPLTGISAPGLATAGLVYQDTLAMAQGVYQGSTATLNVTVLDTIADNFGSYAGDGVGDDWQVQYFGLNNGQAAPGLDPDGDGQNNLFEFRAGYVPIDAGSRLVTRGAGLSGGNFQLELSRVQPGTRYVFQRTTDFVTWTNVITLNPVTVSTPFTLSIATVGTKTLYRVQLEAP